VEVVEEIVDDSAEETVEVVEVVEEESNIIIWLAAGLLINILLIVLGWFIFRKMKKQNIEHADKMSEQLE